MIVERPGRVAAADRPIKNGRDGTDASANRGNEDQDHRYPVPFGYRPGGYRRRRPARRRQPGDRLDRRSGTRPYAGKGLRREDRNQGNRRHRLCFRARPGGICPEKPCEIIYPKQMVSMETDKPLDALIIGSGIGGLSIGIILSLLHLRVAVIEKNALPGGLMRSYQREGMDCPVGIHYFGSFGKGESLRRMCDYLGVTDRMTVERMGQDGPIDRYLFDDFSFDLPEGLDVFEESLERAFPGERQPIAAILNNLRSLADIQNSFAFLSPSPSILDLDLFVPLCQYLAKMNCSPRLRSVLGVASRWLGMSDIECPVLYHHLALVSYLMSSWRLGGSGSALAEAFASRFEELGGVLLCGDPAVTILASGNGVMGVKLASGRVLDTARIVAAIHPKTVLPMLPEGAVTPRYARRIMGLDDTEGMFVANVAVDAAAHPALPHNIYRLHADRDGALRDGVFYQLLRGRGDKNFLMIITKSLFPEWQAWEEATTGRGGGG